MQSTPYRRGELIQMAVQFTPEQRAELDKMAARDDRSVAYLVRMAVDEFLANERERANREPVGARS